MVSKIFKGYYLFLSFFIVLVFSCQSDRKFICNEKDVKSLKYVSLKLRSIWEGDQFRVILDDDRYKWESKIYKHTYYTNYKDEIYIVKSYCTKLDSINVRFFINDRDTNFFINSNVVSSCYLGSTIDKHPIVKLIFRDSLNIINLN